MESPALQHVPRRLLMLGGLPGLGKLRLSRVFTLAWRWSGGSQ